MTTRIRHFVPPLALALSLVPVAAGASFVDTGFDAPGFNVDASAAADYDGDGDLDFVLAGLQDTGTGFLARTALFRNDGGTFTEVPAGFLPVLLSALAWADYDNDGDVDLVLCGNTEPSGFVAATRLYRNDGGTFTNLGSAGLPDVYSGLVAWGDCDNDGDLDLLIAGAAGVTRITRLYRNEDGAFTDTGFAFPGLTSGAAAWADMDGDFDLDLALCGEAGSAPLARIYRNDPAAFTDIVAPLPGGQRLAWVDYDVDGDPDLMICGWNGTANGTTLHVNGAGFVATPTGLPAATGGFAWADYDHDGDVDLALAGIGNSPSNARVYRNDGGTLVDAGAGLAGTRGPNPVWADLDNDGRLDLLNAGMDYGGVRKVYRNTIATPNAAPSTPNITFAFPCPIGLVQFLWDPSPDAETPAAGMTYNLRVGTTPGGAEVVSPHANATTGYRRVPATGNVGHPTSARLRLPPGTYYWSVQSVDGGLAVSPFAPEHAILVPGVDGVRTGEYGSALAVQGVQTAFGDATLGAIDFANGSELDGAHAYFGACDLRLMITGNLESNFNKLELFFETKPGGQNRLRGDNANVDFDGLNRMGDDGSGNGLRFDPGFEPDYWIGLTGGDVGGGQYRFFVNWAELPTTGGGVGWSLGGTSAGSDGRLVGGINPSGLIATIHNGNTAGVTGGTGPASGLGVATGVELVIPHDALGDPAGCVRICAFVNGVQHDFVSNQVLGSLTAPQDFLGEPRNVDFGALSGTQYFQVCPGTPAGAPAPAIAAGRPRLAVSPNPVRAVALARFELAEFGDAHVEVYDVQGKRVRRLASGAFGPGWHQAVWTGTDDAGRALPGGVYFVRLASAAGQEARRVVLRR